MKQPTRLKKEVETLFEKNARLLSDVHSTKRVLMLLNRQPWKSEGIIASQIKGELMITDAAVSGKVKKLLQQRLVTSEKGKPYQDRKTGRKIHDGRAKLLLLTERGRKIADYLESFELPIRARRKGRPSISAADRSRAREFHSARLRELIERMLPQLPQVHREDVYLSSLDFPRKKYDGDRLPFENEVLFDDLRNHLLDYDKLNKSHTRFKKSCRDFRRMKQEILEEIRLDISKRFGLRFSPAWGHPDSFLPAMAEWIFEAGIYLGKGDLKRHFKEYFLDFQSEAYKGTLPGRKTIQYRIVGTDFMLVARDHSQADAFKREIDEKLKAYLRGLGDAPYSGGIAKASALLGKAKTSREDLMAVLRKNLEVPIFDGDCEFLAAASGTG